MTFEGEYYRTESATIYDKPDEVVPIYVAAGGPTASKFAGRVADGFICTSGKAPELYSETLLPNVQEGLEKSGRSLGDIEKTIEMKVSFDTDIDRAMQDTSYWAALALSPERKNGCRRPGGNGEALRCVACRTRRQSMDRFRRSRRTYRTHRALYRTRIHAHWFFMHPDLTRSVSFACTRKKFLPRLRQTVCLTPSRVRRQRLRRSQPENRDLLIRRLRQGVLEGGLSGLQ